MSTQRPHKSWCSQSNVTMCNCRFPSGDDYIPGHHGPAPEPGACVFCGKRCYSRSPCAKRKEAYEGVAAPLEPSQQPSPEDSDWKQIFLTCLAKYPWMNTIWTDVMLAPIADAMEAYAAAVSKNLRQRSMTWGDLPEAVRVLCGNLKPPMHPHEWDNMNISEQRDWAVKQLDISERFLTLERINHQTSIHQWGKDEARILELEKEITALRETK